MKRKVLLGAILCELGILIGVTYARDIIPLLIASPLQQEVAQDYIGARALINQNEELYPVLITAYEKMGISLAAYHRSTHPPTAFLLVVPFALLDYRSSLILWMVAMFACIVLTARALGLAWKMSILAAVLALAWPPTIWSLGQFTPIWLLGLVLAYRFRRNPFVSGVNIALASLPKYLATPALLYHLWRRKLSVLIGFGVIWLVALAALFLLRPDAMSTYINSNIGNSLDQILRPNNGAVVVVAWRLGGWPGITTVAVLILCVLWTGLHNEGPAGWACLVWLGIAFLPIAWVYSLLPLLPWLVMTIRSSRAISRILAVSALLLPYMASLPSENHWFVALSIALSGISLAFASSGETPLTAATIRQDLASWRVSIIRRFNLNI